MKKEIMIKSGLIAITSLFLIITIFYAIKIKVRQEMNLVTTYVAARDISPRSKIVSEDLLEIKIPKIFILDFTWNQKSDLIGKYTDIQGKIPAGSVFYKTMIYQETNLPDYPSLQLKKNQSAFTMEVNLETLGGCIVGQRVDLFITILQNNAIPLSDCLVENARIISIKDHSGLEIKDGQTNQIPYLATLAVESKDVALLSKSKNIGKISLISSDKSYMSQEAILKTDSGSYKFLMQETEK